MKDKQKFGIRSVYGSPFVRKVLAVLAIKDLPFEHISQSFFEPVIAQVQPGNSLL